VDAQPAFCDGLLEAAGVDGGVDRGGADVGVTGELADHCGVGAGVGEVGAEGVTPPTITSASSLYWRI
jgi:hypothetical protein